MRKLSNTEVIDSFNKKHFFKYGYSNMVYINDSTKIEIICNNINHPNFWQSPNNHKKGHGCPRCGDEKVRLIHQDNLNKVISDFKNTHGDKYDYSKIIYKNTSTKVEIGCLEHGPFWQVPLAHKTGSGCPICQEKRGEREIRLFLEENDISFQMEYKFKDSNIPTYRFDFYLEELNICIEFDGEQHFRPVEFFGGKKTFLKIQNRDKLKNRYCNLNDIILLRISYLDFKEIKNILKDNIK